MFLPILRSEINSYVKTWNEHSIRPQKHRPNHVAGVPNELYLDPKAKRYGWIPDSQFLSNLHESVKDVGEFILSLICHTILLIKLQILMRIYQMKHLLGAKIHFITNWAISINLQLMNFFTRHATIWFLHGIDNFEF